MKLKIKPVTDGPLDGNFKAGDVTQVYLDTDLAQPGTQEKKTHLIIAVDDPLNSSGQPFPAGYMAQLKEEFAQEEYQPGPTPDEVRIRRVRKYAIPDWESRFSPEELAIIKDEAAVLPDGPTYHGGTVADGVVSGLFAFADVVRK